MSTKSFCSRIVMNLLKNVYVFDCNADILMLFAVTVLHVLMDGKSMEAWHLLQVI